ncbi:MAG: dTMP kinase [Deltaproteobacteria bacterium]|nr:dTMP kinase [Deltaproteobacteria bacterium]
MNNQGKLIVIEGIDGAGTTTQSEYICSNLKNVGIKAYQTAQPSRFPVGVMIRSILQKDLMNVNGAPPGFDTMSLLFAADRAYQQAEEIIPQLEKGVTVICDRYVYSSVFYQSVSSSNSEDSIMTWIKNINKYIRKPDLVIYLKIDERESFRRRGERGEKEEIFEKTEFQKKLITLYDRIDEIFKDDNILTIDATLPVETIGNKALAAINSLPGN